MRAMEVEGNIDEEHLDGQVDDEIRVLGFPEISSQLNVLNINGNNQNGPNENSNDSIRIIKLPPLMSSESLSNLVRSLNFKFFYAHLQEKKHLEMEAPLHSMLSLPVNQ